MDAHQLLQQLGLAMNLPGLSFDANGCARLLVDGRTAINCENDVSGGCIHLYASIAPIPPEGREAVFRQLLEGNLFGAQTFGATLAVDTLYDEILLCRSIPVAGAEVAGLSQVLESFIAATDDWTQRLAGPVASELPGSLADAPVEPRVQSYFLKV